MTLHIVRDKDTTKNFLDNIPPALLPMIAKFAVSCTDIYLSDHLGDDFAAVEAEIVAASWEAGRDALRAVVENRDDGAKSIYRDGKSWYRIPPTKGSFKCQSVF